MWMLLEKSDELKLVLSTYEPAVLDNARSIARGRQHKGTEQENQIVL